MIYIGIDDTDNLDSRGTGFMARSLASQIESARLGKCESVTRHQLLVDRRIPCTSHNSSACLLLKTQSPLKSLHQLCSSFLESRAAAGSDPGLCIAQRASIGDAIVSFGWRAKSEVLSMDEAQATAARTGLLLSGHGGTRQGIIGALAAVGLRHSGNDGRFLALKGIRQVVGELTMAQMLEQTGVERFVQKGQEVVPAAEDVIVVGDWFRPVLQNDKATLLIELVSESEERPKRWRVVAREIVKKF